MNSMLNTPQSTNENSIPHKNVYGYIRVSTETQADKGYGLDIQEAAIKEYCQTHDLNLVKVFIDAGKSGTIGDKDNLESRPALSELLQTLNGTNSIIVMNTSRLWRDDGARTLVSIAVKKVKGEIVSIEQPKYSLYSTNPQDFFFNSMMELIDQYDRMNINMRLTKGKNEKAKQGYKPAGRAPFGYQWNKATRKIEINHDEAEIVRAIFETARGRLCFQDIANLMNKSNKLGKNKKEWSRQSVRVILMNKFYKGILTHDGEDIRGQHAAIIDTELFDYVQTCRNITQEEMDEMFSECL